MLALGLEQLIRNCISPGISEVYNIIHTGNNYIQDGGKYSVMRNSDSYYGRFQFILNNFLIEEKISISLTCFCSS